jgi:hypothetical protein
MALAVSVAGCTGPLGSCDLTPAMPVGYTYCISYDGASWTEPAVMSDCADQAGTYLATTCGTLSGQTCTFNGGTDRQTRYVYQLTDGDAGVDLRATCGVAGGFYAAM